MKRPTAAGRAASKDERDRERARTIADKYFDAEGDPKPAAEVGSPGGPPAEKRLTAKEFRFCEEYLVDLNGTQAAIRAGYSERTAAQIAYENLRKPHIARCITEMMKERSRATRWDAQKLLQRIGDELDADLADLYADNGSLLPVRDWPLVFRQGLVEGIKIREEMSPDGEFVTAHIIEFKTASRTKLKEMIGKHVDVQAFKEKVEHDVTPPLQQLYAQLAGTGIRPLHASEATGLGAPTATPATAAPPAPVNAIRPREPAATEEK